MSVFPRDEDDEIIVEGICYEEIVDANVKLFNYIYTSWSDRLPIVKDTLDLLLKEFDEVRALKVLYDLTQNNINLTKDTYNFFFERAYHTHYGNITDLEYYSRLNQFKKPTTYVYFGDLFNKAIAETVITLQIGDLFTIFGREIMKEVAYFIFHVHNLNYV